MTLIENIADRVISLDIEGDGQPGRAPVEIGVYELHPNLGQSWCWLVRPPGSINHYATKIHGLRDVDVASAPEPHEIMDALFESVSGSLVVGHSIRDDIKALAKAFPAFPILQCLDTLPMAKRLVPGLGQYGLQTVAKALRVRPDKNWRGPHSAGYDAALGALVFAKMCTLPGAEIYLRGCGLPVRTQPGMPAR